MYIIAEVAQAHDGSLGNALHFIRAVKHAGANAVKFQMHYAEAESTKREAFRVNSFPQDLSRYDYWKRMEISDHGWDLIADECQKHDIDLVISPFSLQAVERCKSLPIKALKIGSGEIDNTQLIEACINISSELIISTGMSDWQAIIDCNQFCIDRGVSATFLHCKTEYPCKLDQVGLNNISLIKQVLGSKSGLSDHSGDPHIGIAACMLGAEILGSACLLE